MEPSTTAIDTADSSGVDTPAMGAWMIAGRAQAGPAWLASFILPARMMTGTTTAEPRRFADHHPDRLACSIAGQRKRTHVNDTVAGNDGDATARQRFVRSTASGSKRTGCMELDGGPDLGPWQRRVASQQTAISSCGAREPAECQISDRPCGRDCAVAHPDRACRL